VNGGRRSRYAFAGLAIETARRMRKRRESPTRVVDLHDGGVCSWSDSSPYA